MSTLKYPEWLDLSIPISHGMTVWPRNPKVSITRVRSLDRGDVCNLSDLHIGAHSGTHIDGLNHFVKDAPGIDEMPLALMTGLARVIEIDDPEEVTAKELIPYNLQPGERVLFKTHNSTELHPLTSFAEKFSVASPQRKAALELY